MRCFQEKRFESTENERVWTETAICSTPNGDARARIRETNWLVSGMKTEGLRVAVQKDDQPDSEEIYVILRSAD